MPYNAITAANDFYVDHFPKPDYNPPFAFLVFVSVPMLFM